MPQVLISNNIRIRGATTPIKAEITKRLTIPNPAYQKARRIGKRGWGIAQKLELYVYDQGDLVVPRGFETELRDIFQERKVEATYTNSQTIGVAANFGTWNESFILRDYQKPFIEVACEMNGIGVAPAGSGKTIMGLRYVMEKGRIAVWLTHTTDLMHQTKAKAEKLFSKVGRVGMFGDGHHDWGDGKLIIATVQTLNAQPKLIDAMNEVAGTVVIDEAHHFPAVQFIETAGKFTAKNMLGVTATPERKDGLECYMFRGIGPIVHRVERSDLYDNGELIKPEVQFVYTDFSNEYASDRNELNSVDAGGDDMDYTALMQNLIADDKRAEQLAANIVKQSDKGHAIVITESVRYCFVLQELVQKQLEKQGKKLKTAVVHGGISRYKWLTKRPPASMILDEKQTGKTKKYKVESYTEEEFAKWQIPAAKRREIMAEANDKRIDILFATQLAREGLDMPHLTVGHMAMPKRGDGRGANNGAAVEQEIGRIMRADPANPNKKAFWFDYVDANVGVLNDQYYSRRKVYNRLGIKLARKPRTDKDQIESFLNSGNMFDLPY